MKIVSGFLVYCAYVTYKSHFNQKSTDISKYNYNLYKPEYNTFLNTKGLHYYDKLAKRLETETEVISILISAFLNDPNVWIGDIYQDLPKYIDLKEKREARISNIVYIFKKDCIYLIDNGLKFNKGMGSFVLSCFFKCKVELETFIILKNIFNFNLDNDSNYEYIYKGKFLKYEKLFNVDIEKYKKLLEEVVMTYRED